MKHKEAMEIVKLFLPMIIDCDGLESLIIGGSLRRQKPNVGDAEIIWMGDDRVLDRLDTLVHNGNIEKALYGEKQQTRWGNKLRGILYNNLKIEMFRAQSHTLGYIQWLRTGPGDMNTWMMSISKSHGLPVRFEDGEGVHYDQDSKRHILNIPDEFTFWKILGMPSIEAQDRTFENFKECWNWAYWAREDIHSVLVQYHKPVAQFRMF